MIGRELGGMYVENDVIKVIETQPVETAMDRQLFLPKLAEARDKFPHGTLIVSEWWAVIGDQPVAYGLLGRIDDEKVDLFVGVLSDKRGLGLGAFMIRCGTDMAIRHRVRQIFVKVESQSPIIRLLEEDGYEKLGQDGLIVIFQKELQWQ